MRKKVYLTICMIMMLIVMMPVSVFAEQGETPVIDIDDHTHVTSSTWSYNATHHWHTCTDSTCAEVFDKSAHAWKDGVVTTEPTETTTGVKTFTCAVCGATRTETLLKVNPLKISAQSKSYKASKVKKSSKSFTVKVSKNVGKLSTSRNEAAKKAKIKIKKVKAKSGTKKYKVMIPKKCKKGIYEVNINAAGGNGYQAGSKTIKIVVK